mmetsp:Transcript_177029/g.567767  ORF Transcript_177029/g.567767 Transcript_177029/m.567767 type:complete len:244 (-) Transcript_177029:2406-3137(-)
MGTAELPLHAPSCLHHRRAGRRTRFRSPVPVGMLEDAILALAVGPIAADLLAQAVQHLVRALVVRVTVVATVAVPAIAHDIVDAELSVTLATALPVTLAFPAAPAVVAVAAIPAPTAVLISAVVPPLLPASAALAAAADGAAAGSTTRGVRPGSLPILRPLLLRRHAAAVLACAPAPLGHTPAELRAFAALAFAPTPAAVWSVVRIPGLCLFFLVALPLSLLFFLLLFFLLLVLCRLFLVYLL